MNKHTNTDKPQIAKTCWFIWLDFNKICKWKRQDYWHTLRERKYCNSNRQSKHLR